MLLIAHSGSDSNPRGSYKTLWMWAYAINNVTFALSMRGCRATTTEYKTGIANGRDIIITNILPSPNLPSC
jgi:hypothetical protein